MDHPRSRGEYGSWVTWLAHQPGSSPLSRGIRGPHPGRIRSAGIIPALAGNTNQRFRVTFQRSDHPRSRGEYLGVFPSQRGFRGSSPLSRGIHAIAALRPQYVRIIPALAGNTCSRRGRLLRLTDHPRSRGEYPRRPANPGRSAGSSPLSRGILCDAARPAPFHGIIPALAGNTCVRSTGRGRSGDHPRSRGEYPPPLPHRSPYWGSSPLSRGIQPCLFRLQNWAGIIPALAGNTAGDDPPRGGVRDHPRSRGEYLRPVTWSMPKSGSSPLSRGIPPLGDAKFAGAGIIPALAGNTLPRRPF